MNIKISTIIPVYNAEKFIEKTVSSVLNQTYKNIEIILVNDCSKDKSKEICNKLSEKNKNIKVINLNKNQGVSHARNIGIIESIGDYIHFMDSDDTITPDMYEKIVQYIEKETPDLVITGVNYYVNDKYKDSYKPKNNLCNTKNKIGKYLTETVITGRRSNLNFIWNKLFKKEKILKNKVKFDEALSLGEDFMFNTEFIMKSNKIRFIDDAFYNYNKYSVSSSLTAKFRPNILELRKIYYERWIDFYKYYNTYESVKIEIDKYEGSKLYEALKSLSFIDCCLEKREKIEFIEKVKKHSKYNYMLEYMKNKNKNTKIERELIIRNKYNIVFSIWNIWNRFKIRKEEKNDKN